MRNKKQTNLDDYPQRGKMRGNEKSGAVKKLKQVKILAYSFGVRIKMDTNGNKNKKCHIYVTK